MDSNVLSALLGTMGGVIVAILSLIPLFRRVQRERDKADLALVNINAMKEMLDVSTELYERFKQIAEESMEKEKALKVKIFNIERQLIIMSRVAQKLYEQVATMGGKPIVEVPEIKITNGE